MDGLTKIRVTIVHTVNDKKAFNSAAITSITTPSTNKSSGIDVEEKSW